MKIKAKYVGDMSIKPAFEDEEFPPMGSTFVKGRTYEFNIMGMTLYPPQTGGKIVRYSSLASFLRHWDDIKVVEL